MCCCAPVMPRGAEQQSWGCLSSGACVRAASQHSSLRRGVQRQEALPSPSSCAAMGGPEKALCPLPVTDVFNTGSTAACRSGSRLRGQTVLSSPRWHWCAPGHADLPEQRRGRHLPAPCRPWGDSRALRRAAGNTNLPPPPEYLKGVCVLWAEAWQNKANQEGLLQRDSTRQ